ncbi:MAG: hypothetical protein QM820_05055 [Minicystis sp.]
MTSASTPKWKRGPALFLPVVSLGAEQSNPNVSLNAAEPLSLELASAGR